ncbi:transcription antitermination factor NusB [Candidatus Uabimicrobium amorphum]|uniref:Ribosomal RNA small subunit methyltransferase B n=1 Tax=Uabimicrobium amorphum TaxID=2596890 RepID=A0A5S9F606_UABAM|nr:transcription antitermination factor NusB [Candidatus Uabimicrobium amorphum]BBM87396.1 ribosomal RNA small subunit methyltransferase B [Candidatus Uabimicrobium amorphum]
MYNVRNTVLEILNKNARFWDQHLHLSNYSTVQSEKNLITEIVNGIQRRKLTLQYLIKHYSHGKPQPAVYNCLLLGIYELLFLEKVPAYAVIHSCVEHSKKISKKSAKYVNAVLRNIQRSVRKEQKKYSKNYLPISHEDGWYFSQALFPEDKIRYLSVVYSYPEYLVDKWCRDFGEEQCIHLLLMGNTRPGVTVRVRNSFRCDELQMIDGKMAKVSGDVSLIPGYHEGDWVVQGLASSETIELIEIAPRSLVLDLCAAPGGKSFHIADNMRGEGVVVSGDKSVERLRKMCENKERLQLQNIQPIAMNSKKLPKNFAQHFDCVVVDAPCSNSAVFNKRVEARWRFSVKNLQKLNKEQYKLLRSGATAVKPGGKLVYSTCSIEKEENENLIAEFLKEHDDFCCWKYKRMFPQLPFVDGGSVHILCRKA